MERDTFKGLQSAARSVIDYTPGTGAPPPTRTAGPALADRDTPRTNADNCILQFVNSFFPSSSVAASSRLSAVVVDSTACLPNSLRPGFSAEKLATTRYQLRRSLSLEVKTQ